MIEQVVCSAKPHEVFVVYRVTVAGIKGVNGVSAVQCELIFKTFYISVK